MLTVLTALTTLGGCTAARWYLDRTSRRDSEYAGGRVRLRSLWNEGAAFSLHSRFGAVIAASFAALGALWTQRKRAPVGVGLILGGGLSNLLERLRQGKVYDYVQFPKAPGRLKQYIFNLADFAILLGGLCLSLRKKKRSSKRPAGR